jgi:hypothetical protein
MKLRYQGIPKWYIPNTKKEREIAWEKKREKQWEQNKDRKEGRKKMGVGYRRSAMK